MGKPRRIDPEGYKWCYKCDLLLEITYFCKDLSRWDGLCHSCKTCSNNRRKVYLADKPDKRKGYALKADFGISMEDFNQMLTDQDGKCAVCGTPPNSRHLAVDHCHQTGKVRSLLCHGCNTALGLLREDPEIARSLAVYMEEHCDRVS